jgi:hypothetical protein
MVGSFSTKIFVDIIYELSSLIVMLHVFQRNGHHPYCPPQIDRPMASNLQQKVKCKATLNDIQKLSVSI